MSRTKHHGDKAKQREFGDGWQWLNVCPKEWNKTFHIRPRRAKERNLLQRVIKGDEEQVWPTGNKRPHSYYY